MTQSGRHHPVAGVLAPVVVGVLALRLVVAVAVGIDAATGRPFSGPLDRTGLTLRGFGSAGGATGALLAVAALVLVALSARATDAMRTLTRVLVLLTAVAIVVGATGDVLLQWDFPDTSGIAAAIGYGLADTALCVGGAAALLRLGPRTVATPGAPSRMLFAVDRLDGEVFAFFSDAEARRTLSAYSVEDGEFDFYAEDGTVVLATVEDERIVFTPTDDDRRADLLTQLRRFADRQGLRIDDEQRDDPGAFVAPVNDWQWLQLWPGWLRPIGRLVRALSGGQDRRSKSIAE